MTTLRIEVARCSGTTIDDVLQGLRLAGCMRHVEIDPSEQQFLPIAELQAALERDQFAVELVPWPEPPPLPLWHRVRALPWRAYLWLRRICLGETEEQQLLQMLFDDAETERLHAMAMRESPFLRNVREPKVYTATERETLRSEFDRWRKDGDP